MTEAVSVYSTAELSRAVTTSSYHEMSCDGRSVTLPDVIFCYRTLPRPYHWRGKAWGLPPPSVNKPLLGCNGLRSKWNCFLIVAYRGCVIDKENLELLQRFNRQFHSQPLGVLHHGAVNFRQNGKAWCTSFKRSQPGPRSTTWGVYQGLWEWRKVKRKVL